MLKKIVKWTRKNYFKIVGSIAFYPALIAIAFLILSWVMLQIDVSEGGKQLKGQWSWISLRDASTARSIISTIIGGMISLTVFSFSMVMIVLNQAASQMSNRVLNSMIENRRQQVVLGIYIGSIVYGLFLLSTIRDTDEGIYIPAFSIYLLILIAIVNIFFFIYFLDYITQTVKYETVIQRVETDTIASIKKHYSDKKEKTSETVLPQNKFVLNAAESGFFQGVNQSNLLEFLSEKNSVLRYLIAPSTYILKGNALFEIYCNEKPTTEEIQTIMSYTDIYDGQPVENNPVYGFQHLTEVAVKALSPGINDPATAVLCINALGNLLQIISKQHFPLIVKDEKETPRIIKKILLFDEIFSICFEPIWQYGKEDFMVKKSVRNVFQQLLHHRTNDQLSEAIRHFAKENKIEV